MQKSRLVGMFSLHGRITSTTTSSSTSCAKGESEIFLHMRLSLTGFFCVITVLQQKKPGVKVNRPVNNSSDAGVLDVAKRVYQAWSLVGATRIMPACC